MKANMKVKLMFAALLAVPTLAVASAKAESESEFIAPDAGTYECKAVRAYDSAEETSIIYTTNDELAISIDQGADLIVANERSVSIFSTDHTLVQNSAHGAGYMEYEALKISPRTFFRSMDVARETEVRSLRVRSAWTSGHVQRFAMEIGFRNINLGSHWSRSYHCRSN